MGKRGELLLIYLGQQNREPSRKERKTPPLLLGSTKWEREDHPPLLLGLTK